MTAPWFLSQSRGVAQYRASEVHVGIFDRMYKPNGTRRGVVAIHGAGATADSATNPGNVVREIAAAGYPVLQCDLAAAQYNYQNWANDDHLDAIGDARDYLVNTFGAKDEPVLLFGNSMGGLGSCAWARANLADVLAAAIVVPVLDINYCYQQDAGNGLRAGIGNAWGRGVSTVAAGSNNVNTSTFAGSGTLNVASASAFPSSGTVYARTAGTNATITYTGKTATSLTGCTTVAGGGVLATGNPVWETTLPDLSTRSPVLMDGGLEGLPLHAWASDDDTIASNTAVCEAWDGAGSDYGVTSIGATGHQTTNLDPQEIIQFFDDHGGRT